MLEKPLVSVLINNYNYAKFLSEAIDSVLNQTYINYELIIVDDGSTDNSREIINDYYKQYPDKIIPIYKENGGQASAFNAGFVASKGEVITFLDSDDFWFNNKLEYIIQVHKQYAIVQHNLLAQGKRYKTISNRSDKQKLLKEYGYIGGYIPTSGISFHRKLLEKVFPIPEESLKICAEAFVLCNAVYYENIYSINECLGTYRIHGNNNWFGREKISRTNTILEELNKKLLTKSFQPIPVAESQGEALLNSVDIDLNYTYILYGAGQAGLKFYEYIVNHGGKVNYFSDSNPEKWGKLINGIQVISPKQISNVRSEVDKILIANTFVEDILDLLKELGYKEEEDIIAPTITIKDKINREE